MTAGDLTAPQLGALLDILIHDETYAEVQSFRNPESIETYGWPFVARDNKGAAAKPHSLSATPLLQLLLTRLLLDAPAARDLSTEFWPVKFKEIMRRLGDANLSDSYDKGTLGTRKRLATAASVVHEVATRGLLSGVSCGTLPDLNHPYDKGNAEDLTRAWHDSVRHLVYGNLIDDIFDQLTRTEDLEAHSPAVEAAVEFVELHLATFLHQAFVLSAEGPYLLKLIENVHRLVPYTMIGQTLRLGNAANMINAMSKLFLSKVSMGAISNWIGLTSNAADGMNLMQRIFSLVLEWDAADFRKAVENIKLSREGISDQNMSAIDWHLAADRNQHDSVRKKSIRQQKSIIIAIFETKNPQLLESLTDRQHTACLDYYAAQLAIRDREQIVGVMCRSSPDLTTAIVLEVLGALDPMIRVVHKNVDLRKHLSAIESFLTDFIKTTKPKMRDNSSELRLIAVKDFVELLHRNRHLLYTYLHDFCSGCPDLRDTWRDWMKNAIKAFRQKSKDPGMGAIPVATELGVTNLSDTEQGLQDAFNKLPNQRQAIVLERVNAHSKYLLALQKLSREKMQQIIDEMHGKGHSDVEKISGPGIYAARWQALLDETLITPFIPRGPLRSGKDIKHLRAARRPDAQSAPNTAEMSAAILAQDEPTGPVPPDVSAVTEALGPQFKRIVAYMSRDGLPGDIS